MCQKSSPVFIKGDDDITILLGYYMKRLAKSLYGLSSFEKMYLLITQVMTSMTTVVTNAKMSSVMIIRVMFMMDFMTHSSM